MHQHAASIVPSHQRATQNMYYSNGRPTPRPRQVPRVGSGPPQRSRNRPHRHAAEWGAQRSPGDNMHRLWTGPGLPDQDRAKLGGSPTPLAVDCALVRPAINAMQQTAPSCPSLGISWGLHAAHRPRPSRKVKRRNRTLGGAAAKLCGEPHLPRPVSGPASCGPAAARVAPLLPFKSVCGRPPP